jgi:ABC-type transport system involved in multi-copper enzyme maturation permease subunit
MNQSMIKILVLKDLYFNKNNLLLFCAMGLISVYLLSFDNRAFYIGMVLLISMVILIGALLIFSTVVNERKNQTLTFLMSLPITCMDYTKAKLIVNLSAYFVAWAILVVATIAVIFYSPHLSNGLIPYALIILLEMLVAFIIVLSTALVSESEAATIVVVTIANIGVSLFMYLIATIGSINQHMKGSVAVWNKPALMIIGIEIMIGVLFIGLTLYLQSRKKGFI